MSFLDERCATRLNTLASQGRRRQLFEVERSVNQTLQLKQGELKDFCSNDYLCLGGSDWLKERLAMHTKTQNAGARASRLISGTHRVHVDAERAIAAWLNRSATLLFTSGYAANVGLLSTLLEPDDVVFSDALNHASIIDGIRLSKAERRLMPHNDLAALETELAQLDAAQRGRFVVVESCYSMDGDGPDLVALRALCDRYDAAFIVDEAHSLGVLGPAGRGRCAEMGVTPDVLIGTFGKAFGLWGAFIAAEQATIDWLTQRARSHVFSTAISPGLAATIPDVLDRIVAADDARERLAMNRKRLAAELEGNDDAVGAILGVAVGDERRVIDAGQYLRQRGHWVGAIRPPTVSEGNCRLRIVIKSEHTAEEIDVLARHIHAWCEAHAEPQS